jgi:hypothetical protein
VALLSFWQRSHFVVAVNMRNREITTGFILAAMTIFLIVDISPAEAELFSGQLSCISGSKN